MVRNLQEKRSVVNPQSKLWLAVALALLLLALAVQAAGPLLSSTQGSVGGFQIHSNIEPGGNQGDGNTNGSLRPTDLIGLAVSLTGALVLGGSLVRLTKEQA